MIKAATVDIISKEASEKTVEEAFNKDGLISNIEKFILSYAESGCNYCTYCISDYFMENWQEIVLRKAEPLIKKIESYGYNVILSETIHGKSSTVNVDLYWGNSIKEYTAMVNDKCNSECKRMLYWSLHNLDKLN